MYPPKDDIVFQALFRKGNENITKALIEAVTNEKIESIDLETDKNLLKKYRKEKGGRVDFKAKLNNGVICHIDVQVKEKGNEEKRFLEYWSRIYTEQLEQGEQYQDLKKTISIIILDYEFKKIKELKEIVTKWKIIEAKYGKIILTDDFELYIIEIPKAVKRLQKEPNNKLAQWMSFFDNPEKEGVSQIMKTNKEIEEAMKKLEEINSDEELKRIIQIRQRAERENLMEKAMAKEEGREEGISIGEARGLMLGEEKRIQEKIKIAKELLKKGMKIEEIIEIVGLSKEEIEKQVKYQI